MTTVTITGQKTTSSILADCLSDILAEVKSSSDSGDKINSNQAVGKSVFPITGLRGSCLWDWWGCWTGCLAPVGVGLGAQIGLARAPHGLWVCLQSLSFCSILGLSLWVLLIHRDVLT